jgi:hypothetical protein
MPESIKDYSRTVIDKEYLSTIENRSDDDLFDILSRIDRDQCPLRFNALILVMGKRGLIGKDLTADDIDKIQLNRPFREARSLHWLILKIIVGWGALVGIFALVRWLLH